ncbi:MAG TPA: inorganic diphosphatase [Candidatus Caccopulliclostridium gallistercoris]|uniref:Inorganic pyrophosphatase n=1 Tax=Candidatus Caccopulliclostridium gallistercoris TaxID=2840719 RepID=A0A9D1NEC2_9FIRM|nr:inorganic diphosphatase [Candidatus Caccopulliclostridium gallistercoris]
MNILHDISEKRIQPEDFIACIEIEKGSKNKYELDKETGMIILDRVLYTSTHYPMNYGFIPRTLSGDDDPLDVFVLCSQPIEKMSLVRCYPIGIIYLTDRNETDEKVIAIPFGDPQYNEYTDISELPSHIIDELRHFLSVYKQLENKVVKVLKVGSHEDAKRTIKESLENYKRNIK